MKKWIVILSLLVLIVFAGCEKADNAPAPAVTLPLPPTETVEQPKEEETTPPGVTIDTPYYSIPLFDKWADSCVVEYHQMSSGLPVVSLFEKTAYESFGGGKLCSIQLMPVSDDTYKDFPSYQLLGALETPEGNFNLIVLFPTDVQYDAGSADAYNAMAAELMDVLFTISPREGMVLVMPAPTP